MFIYCCCCFKPTTNLLSMKTKSSHEDGKTLLDYLNYLSCAFLRQYHPSDVICTRCSKALQVTYHFINMVKKFKDNKEKVRKEMWPKIQDKQCVKTAHNKICFSQIQFLSNDERTTILQNILLDKWHIEDQLKFRTDSGMSMENVPLLKMNNNLKLSLPDFNTDFICNICNTSFDDKINFVEHNKQKHKDIIPYKCKLCNFFTCYAESLFKHCQKNHGLSNVTLDLYQNKEVPKIADDGSPGFGITYSCNLCNFKDSHQAAIDEHLLSVHPFIDDRESFVEQVFSCPACCRSFATLKAAKIHYSMYHICSFKNNNVCKKRKFCCEKCGKAFDLKSGLFMHRSVCEKRKVVNCNFCNMEFTSVLKYERHLQDTHFVAIKHECETCSKTFKCPEYLAVHRKRHNERNFQCDLCPKNYISNAELKVHKQRIHDVKQAAIACSVCNKKFVNLTLLKYHENMMHKVHFHHCSFCEFVSKSRSALKLHQFNHTGKPYKCHLCQKEFAVRVLLRQHLKKHHSTSLTNEDMAEMFKQAYGYTSRYDAFSEQNNNLEIAEMNDIEYENEIKEFGLNLKDIMEDLFHQE